VREREVLGALRGGVRISCFEKVNSKRGEGTGRCRCRGAPFSERRRALPRKKEEKKERKKRAHRVCKGDVRHKGEQKKK